MNEAHRSRATTSYGQVTNLPHVLRPWLQLVRLPAVFTAMADIFLGFLLTHRSLAEAPWDFALLLAASSCLYMAGMVFNDVFDRRVDAVERPGRPIPSGRVPLRGAVVLGFALVLIGLLAAAFVGWDRNVRGQSLLIAGVLTVCIFAYDGLLKNTPLGPVAMGACRFFNVILGASAIPGLILTWDVVHVSALAMPQRAVAAGLGLYIVGVTWFARGEAGRSSRAQLIPATVVVNLGLIVLLGFVSQWPGEAGTQGVLMALLVIMLVINRRLAAALFQPTPRYVQPAVQTMLMSVVVIDAVLVYFKTDNAALALATVALLVPAVLLGRWLYVT